MANPAGLEQEGPAAAGQGGHCRVHMQVNWLVCLFAACMYVYMHAVNSPIHCLSHYSQVAC